LLKEVNILAEKLNQEISGEAFNKFHADVAKLEALEARRAEIIKNAIEGEKNIANIRIGALQTFFDEYSEGLTDILTNKTSELEEPFLILDGLIKSSAKNASDAIKDVSNEAEKAQKVSVKRVSKNKSGGVGGNGSGGGSGGGNSGSGSGGGGKTQVTPNVVSALVEQIVDEDTLDELESNLEDVQVKLEQYAAFLRQNSEIRQNTLESEEGYLLEIENRYSKKRTSRLEDQLAKQQKIEESMMDLANMRLHAEEEVDANITDLRLSQQQSLLDAEMASADFSNTLKAQIEYATNPELVAEATEMKQQEDDAKNRLKEEKAISEAIAKDKAKLELYYKRKNNGVLSKEDALAVAKQDVKVKEAISGKEVVKEIYVPAKIVNIVVK
jgi:hypothetical protein